jgi:hypothetical protein
MRGLFRNLLIGLAALPLGGCLVYNTAPLSPPETATIDQALLGGWDSTPDADATVKERLELDITRDGEHALLIAVTSYESDGSTRQHVYHAHSSVHSSANGEQRYLNAFTTPSDRNLRGYITARYSIAGEALKIELLDVPATRTAIQSGGLEGIVGISSEYADVTVTMAGETFVSYLEEHPQLFSAPVNFIRRGKSP